MLLGAAAAGGVFVGPRLSGGLDFRDGPGQLRVLEASQVCVRQGERVAVDAVVPGPTGGGGEALEGVVGVGGARRPAAAAAVGHRVQGGVVRGQLLRRGGGGEGGASQRVAPSRRQRAAEEEGAKMLLEKQPQTFIQI